MLSDVRRHDARRRARATCATYDASRLIAASRVRKFNDRCWRIPTLGLGPFGKIGS